MNIPLQGGHQKFGFQIEDNRGQKEDQIEDIFLSNCLCPQNRLFIVKRYMLWPKQHKFTMPGWMAEWEQNTTLFYRSLYMNERN